jgi:4-hydroxybenzoate polyprenyltransferase/phosphoserine phosphatase
MQYQSYILRIYLGPTPFQSLSLLTTVKCDATEMSTRPSHHTGADFPLCVDLDGTLVKSDLMFESFFALCKRNILFILFCAIWLLKGKAYLKQQIAEHVDLDMRLLPYHKAFLSYLRDQHTQGRRLILCTASHEKFARQVAAHLGLFADVVASDGIINLAGENKLRRLIAMFGIGGFDYAGNSHVDLTIWPHARRSILVNPAKGVQDAAERVSQVEQVFQEDQPQRQDYLRALRLHQWLKNILVFVPLVAAHQLDELTLVVQASLGFIAFCLCASSVYILNDLLDLSADRQHPRKQFRPFAKGALSIKSGTLLIPLLLIAALSITLALPEEFLLVLAIYYGFTLAYSLWLKKKVLVDVLVLAGLYTLRIIAGSAAVSIPLSFWLLAFSMFLFLSLALVKRYSELCSVLKTEHKFIQGRGYQVLDLTTLNSLGTSSGYLAVLVLALYINSYEISVHYTHVQLIWLLCPLLLYWISRIWVIASRGKMHDDPVVFTLQDRPSQWIGVVAAVILWLAV